MVALLTRGHRSAVGTVWDGIATARLAVALGYVDSATGTRRDAHGASVVGGKTASGE